MGRQEKVTAEEIKESLESGQHTKSELSTIHGVCKATISNKVRRLRQDGDAIIHNQNGMLLVDKKMLIADAEVSEILRGYLNWLLRLYQCITYCATPTKPLLPTLKKVLKEKLTKDERKELAIDTARFRRVLDYMEIEEETD